MHKYRLSHFSLVISLCILLSLLLGACDLVEPVAPAPEVPGIVNTLAAATLQAIQAQNASTAAAAAAATVAAQNPANSAEPATPGGPSLTPSPYPTSTLAPSSTPLPSATPLPTRTPTPRFSPTPEVACNDAQFVQDVTVPDNTVMGPGENFDKTWRIKNTGSCTWEPETYSFVFVTGDPMGGDTVSMPKTVRPGAGVDITVEMEAPLTPGTYRGNWMVRDNQSGVAFGSSATKAFWVIIQVSVPDSGLAFDMVNGFCSATWSTNKGPITCGGKTNDPNGFVTLLENPHLENRKEEEPALWTNPPSGDNSWIRGVFPAFQFKDGDRFLANIGCLYDHPDCDVIFQVSYIDATGNTKKLGEWNETSDGSIALIDLDLSFLDGKSVQLMLQVSSNGSSKDDAAFWLVPQIKRE